MAKQAKQQQELPSMWERTNYEILDRWEEDGCTVTKIRNTYNGGIAYCKVPHHTPEEEHAVIQNILRAAVKMCGIDPDVTKVTVTR